MKKFLLIGLSLVAVGSLVRAVDLTDIPNEAGPYQIKTTVNANNALLEAESDTLVSNVTVQTATITATVTRQPGATVTATAAATPQNAAISVAFTPQTVSLTDTNGVTAVCWTGCTATVTAPTNVSIAVTVANGVGLLTNATATVAGVTTNVVLQRP